MVEPLSEYQLYVVNSLTALVTVAVVASVFIVLAAGVVIVRGLAGRE